MLKGIDKEEKIEYITKKDDKENPTIFLIGNISNRDKLALFSDVVDPSTLAVNLEKIQSKYFDILQKGLKGIKNFGGLDIDVITPEVIDSIEFTIALEVVAKIIEFNFNSGEETKNS